jgi:hypothetical protein
LFLLKKDDASQDASKHARCGEQERSSRKLMGVAITGKVKGRNRPFFQPRIYFLNASAKPRSASPQHEFDVADLAGFVHRRSAEVI